MKTEPLLKLLAAAGIGSRRRLADAIRQGRVKINDEMVEDFRHPVNRKTDRISVDNQPVDLKPRQTVCLMLNKPRDVMSTTSDERGRRTVLDLLSGKYRHLRLYPVGRLDKDSTGLLLLTNDGELTYHLTHPRFEHKKEYLIHIDGSLKTDDKRRLEQGIKLAEGKTHPAVVKEVKSSPPFNYSITIHEGRKRQVRRMLAALRHHILALKRIRMGNLSLGDLKEGEIRELSAQEISRLMG